MRTLTLTLLMLLSTAAYAQSGAPQTSGPPAAGPVLHVATDDSSTNRLDVELGAVKLTTHSGRYTFAYLPFLAPLQSTAFRPSMEIPDALALTGTTIPQRPHVRSSAQVLRKR